MATPAKAQDTAVPCPLSTFSGAGLLEQQPGFAPVARRDLMAALNTVARARGMRPATLVVLDALLSCLPCRDRKSGRDGLVTPATLLTVYASNETLCFRARGLTDRQLRRHLSRLEELGFLTRRDSANGKRFPLRRGNRVIGAFGLDLSPLLAQSAQILAEAEQVRARAEELTGLKSCIRRLRSLCLGLPLSEAERGFAEGLDRVLRRVSLSLTEARGLLQRLQGLHAAQTAPAAEEPPVEIAPTEPASPTAAPKETPASDGQNVRHIDPRKPDTKKPLGLRLRALWQSLEEIPQFFPEAPVTRHDLHRVVFSFAHMLNLTQSTVAEALARRGEGGLLQILDRIAAKATEIDNPEAYLRQSLRGGSQSWPWPTFAGAAP
jgi:replication initiation protein RepC